MTRAAEAPTLAIPVVAATSAAAVETLAVVETLAAATLVEAISAAVVEIFSRVMATRPTHRCEEAF
jgi:hypothetical protein